MEYKECKCGAVLHLQEEFGGGMCLSCLLDKWQIESEPPVRPHEQQRPASETTLFDFGGGA